MLALLTGACASSSPAPISFGNGGATAEQRAEQTAPPQRTERRGRATIEQRGAQAQLEAQAEGPAPPVRAPAVQEQPNWADGEGTPLSAYAMQPSEVFDPAHLPRTHFGRLAHHLWAISGRFTTAIRAD